MDKELRRSLPGKSRWLFRDTIDINIAVMNGLCYSHFIASDLNGYTSPL